jgi:hypothetical protein
MTASPQRLSMADAQAVRGRSPVEDAGKRWSLGLQVSGGWPAAGQLAIGEHRIYDIWPPAS